MNNKIDPHNLKFQLVSKLGFSPIQEWILVIPIAFLSEQMGLWIF